MKKNAHIPNPKMGKKYLAIFKKMVEEKRAWENSLKNVDAGSLMKKSIPVE